MPAYTILGFFAAINLPIFLNIKTIDVSIIIIALIKIFTSKLNLNIPKVIFISFGLFQFFILIFSVTNERSIFSPIISFSTLLFYYLTINNLKYNEILSLSRGLIYCLFVQVIVAILFSSLYSELFLVRSSNSFTQFFERSTPVDGQFASLTIIILTSLIYIENQKVGAKILLSLTYLLWCVVSESRLLILLLFLMPIIHFINKFQIKIKNIVFSLIFIFPFLISYINNIGLFNFIFGLRGENRRIILIEHALEKIGLIFPLGYGAKDESDKLETQYWSYHLHSDIIASLYSAGFGGLFFLFFIYYIWLTVNKLENLRGKIFSPLNLFFYFSLILMFSSVSQPGQRLYIIFICLILTKVYKNYDKAYKIPNQ